MAIAVIAGVGPGLGASLARRFSHGYDVALLARRADYLEALAREIRESGRVACEFPTDLSRPDEIVRTFAAIRDRLGPADVLLYNAGSAAWGNLAAISEAQFESAWRINALGAFVCAKQAVGAMLERGHGAMLFTGATAGVKAGARSAAFGPAKFALRGLAQSLARDLGPRGIHCVYVNIDGMIDIPGRERPKQIAEQDMLKPDAIAEAYWYFAHQDRSAWSMEAELRPFKEKF